MEEVTFSASFPEIQSAISIGGAGGRIKLDVPETEMAALVKLAAYGRGKELVVTVKDAGEGQGA
jgi:hypothetical protein